MAPLTASPGLQSFIVYRSFCQFNRNLALLQGASPFRYARTLFEPIGRPPANKHESEKEHIIYRHEMYYKKVSNLILQFTNKRINYLIIKISENKIKNTGGCISYVCPIIQYLHYQE